jgi:Cdc6-like AAA superfamily ATPase
MNELILYSNNDFYNAVLNFIYEKYNDKINRFEYLAESTIKPYEYVRRNEINKIKVCIPDDTTFDLEHGENQINFTLESVVKVNGDLNKMIIPGPGCHSAIKNIIHKKIILKGETKEILLDFVDVAKDHNEKQIKLSRISTSKTIKVNMWRKEYWNLLFKSPKRPIETLYLKKGQKEEILKNVNDFYNPDTRAEYLSHGIPYKNVFMLYGPPGTGKTSTINTIASYFDSDVYVIPISKELTDYGLIDAISYLEEKEDNKRIIVIEDIDSIFTDRKKGDDDNGITLQGLLNCFDGFSCVEGTLLFITANNPEVIDDALFRSCRVDYKYELGYADKYQTQCIFERMAPINDRDTFTKFYRMIENHQYTTAMLQEFLFYNRSKDTIYDIMDEFHSIIDNNKKGHFESKEKNELIYS